VHLAAGDFGDDEVAGEDSEVKAIAYDLDDAGPGRVRHGAEFEGDEDGGNHSKGEYGEEGDFRYAVVRAHPNYADEREGKNDKKQNADGVVNAVD
jgi:hypothetical protein